MPQALQCGCGRQLTPQITTTTIIIIIIIIIITTTTITHNLNLSCPC
jgi:hypothetical protein